MDGPGVGHEDRELVEVRTRMDARGTGGGEGLLEAGGTSRALGGDVTQAVRADRCQVDRGGQGEERLVRADVAGRLVAPDVLLARA